MTDPSEPRRMTGVQFMLDRIARDRLEDSRTIAELLNEIAEYVAKLDEARQEIERLKAEAPKAEPLQDNG